MVKGRRTAYRERIAAVEEQGFCPYAVWRDAEGRLGHMEQVFAVKLALRHRLVGPIR